MNRKIAVIALITVLNTMFAWAKENAQGEGSLNEPKGLAESFLKKIEAGTVDQAYDELLAGSTILEQGQQYQLLKGQTAAQLPILGNALDFEFLEENRIGSSVAVLKYLARYEKDALTWSFVFYRPNETWIVTAIVFLSTVLYLQ